MQHMLSIPPKPSTDDRTLSWGSLSRMNQTNMKAQNLSEQLLHSIVNFLIRETSYAVRSSTDNTITSTIISFSHPHIDICFSILNMHFSIIALATPLLLAARLVAYLSHLMKLGKVVLLLTRAFISVPSLVIIASVRMAMANIMIGPSFAVIISHLPLTHTTMIKSTKYVDPASNYFPVSTSFSTNPPTVLQ